MNHIRSSETVESLMAEADGPSYSKLAQWMTDASEEDIAVFWKGYGGRQKRINDIIDLVFINWTRLNPKGAIATLKGSKDEHYAWWAWACHDPKTALATATAENPDRINNVTWGIGEFHPEWLREHFKELPESSRSNALQGMRKWEDLQDPLASLKFLKENGLGTSAGTFKALARTDPWSALDWVKDNPGSINGYDGSVEDPTGLVIQGMARNSPDDLRRLLAQTPSGAMKVKMEKVLFDSLLLSDPEAALEQAKTAPAPRIAAERYAAIGQGLVRSDPEKAFQMAKELFAACPSALNMIDWVRTPGNGSGEGVNLAGVSDFASSLMIKDPDRMLAITSALPVDPMGHESSFSGLASQWAEEDISGFAGWVNRQQPGTAKENGTNILISQLRQDGHFEEAIDWAMTMDDPGRQRVDNIVINWQRTNPDEASEWLQSSNLPEDQKKRIQASIESQAASRANRKVIR